MKLQGISDKGLKRIAQSMDGSQKKVMVRIDEHDLGDFEGLNIQESMHKYCEQVQNTLSEMWTGVVFDVEWGNNQVWSEGWTEVDYDEELAILDSIDEVQNEVYAQRDWLVDK